jgi:hypothetical protein
MYYRLNIYTVLLCYLITDVGRMGIWVFRLINVLGRPIDWTLSNRWQTVQQGGDAALYTISGAAELLLVSLPYYIDSLVLLFKFVFAGVEFRIDPVLPYIITIS